MTTTLTRGFALLLFASATAVYAQQTPLIPYQGRIAVGSPPVNFDGTGQFKFAVISLDGTQSYWSNDDSSVAGSEPQEAVEVEVTNGTFSLQIGDVTLPNMTSIRGKNVGTPKLLRIWFSDGINGFQLMTPDKRLLPSLLNELDLTSFAAGVTTPLAVADSVVYPNPAIAYYAATSAALQRISLLVAQSSTLGDKVTVVGTGTGGFIMDPPDWTPHAFFANWSALTSSRDGRKLVALGEGIYTSGDSGATWVLRENGDNWWYDVASSSNGNKLVAGVLYGRIHTSSDSGVTWTPRYIDGAWTHVVSSTDGVKLAAASSNGEIVTSADSGVTWTDSTSGASDPGWGGLASSADGSRLFATNGSDGIHISMDSGLNWTQSTVHEFWGPVASSADGTKLVAVVLSGEYSSVGTIHTSSDSGVTWTPRESERRWADVASSADGTRLIGVVKEGLIYISNDSGVTWNAAADAQDWAAIACSEDGLKLVAAGSETQIHTNAAIRGEKDEELTMFFNGTEWIQPPAATNSVGTEQLEDEAVDTVNIKTNAVGSDQVGPDIKLKGTTQGKFKGNGDELTDLRADNIVGVLNNDRTSGTSANTPDKLMLRDSNGDFSARRMLGDLVGNASSATTATSFSNPLAGDVAGTQGNTVVNSVGGMPAADVASGANRANAATDLDTPGTMMKRDVNGDFKARKMIGDLDGNATSATNATNLIGPLAGQVTGTQGNTVVNNVGGVSAANVALAANLANAASSANTPNALVKRDGSGNLSAATVTATAFVGDGSGLTGIVGASGAPAVPSKRIALLKWGVTSTNNTFSVESNPRSACFDGAAIWVANYGSNTVVKLDSSTGALLGTYAVGSSPYAICFDGASIWVANNGSDDVTKLNAATGALIGTYGAGTSPSGICSDGGGIWVANYGSNNLTKLNGGTGALIGTYSAGTNPNGICHDGTYIWVANYGSNNVTQLNASSGALVGNHGVGSNPAALCYDGAHVWVSNPGSNDVTKLNASNGSTIGTYAVGSIPGGLCFDGSSIWVSRAGGGSVTRLNSSTGASIGTYNVGTQPSGICFDGASIWVANYASNNVTKL